MSPNSVATGIESGNFRKGSPVPQFTWGAILTLSFQTLGIVYSDIGTSPLYTLNGLWPTTGPVPPKEDVIGGLSAIIWALTLLPLCKYVFICLRFGTGEGEGGTFALYQGLFPPKMEFDNDHRDSLTLEKIQAKHGSERSAKVPPTISEKARWPLFFWCIFGTSLTLADGIFTPAVSVTSAVAGIAIAKPSVENSVIPISIAFLVVFFLVQSRGTSQLGFTFAPVTAAWFALIAATGIVNICQYPGVFRAFDPSRAILLFVRTKNYDILAGVILALTGCEAMFASMGHFTALSIQISFSCIVYPAVILAYLGQGARLIVDGETVLSNLFYATIPGAVNGPLYWIMFVFAILATFIACQTLITASFSLVQQLMSMHVVPPLRTVYTSETIRGQVYIPAVNWFLMFITILVVGVFKNPVALTNAYGFSVATVMFSTTILISIQMRYVKHWHIIVSAAFLLVFGFLDGLFWGASLKKVPEGAWVPLMIGCILMLLMSFWTWAKGLEDKLDTEHTQESLLQNHFSSSVKETSEKSDSSIMENDDDPAEILEVVSGQRLEVGATELVRLPTCAVFHRLNASAGIPPSFIGFIRKWPALPRIVIFITVRGLHIARAPTEDRYSVHKIDAIEGFYSVTYNLGFRDTFDVNADGIIERICSIEARHNPRMSSAIVKEIRDVARRSTTHIVPRYLVVSKKIGHGRAWFVFNWIRSVLIEDVYRRLATLFPETVNWFGPAVE
ncbi:potassium transporter [Abortiporus biennis]|nr:potassium transporter [Abortiporus biennis]